MKGSNLELFGTFGLINHLIQFIVDIYIFNLVLNTYFNPFIISPTTCYILFNSILFGTLLMGISSIFMYSLNLVKAIRFAIMSLIIIFTSIFYPSISSAYILSKNPFLVFPSLLYDTVILLFNPIIFLIILMILIYLRKRKNYITEAQIRKKILNLAAKFDYLKLKDLAKQINVDKDTIVDTVNKMINAKEVYAEFFNISQKFSFNKQANTAEIDKLLQLYNDWEERQFGKF